MSDGIFVFIIGTVLLGSFLVDKILEQNFNDKMEDPEFAKKYLEEQQSLEKIRGFYVISIIVLILLGIIVYEVLGLYAAYPELCTYMFGVFLIYYGGFGIYSKFMFLRLPIRQTSPIQYVLNSFVVLAGIAVIVNVLINGV